MNYTTQEVKRKYSLKEKIFNKRGVVYRYNKDFTWQIRELTFKKENNYTEEEMKMVDELFSSLDESNLCMIKGILHNRTRKKEKGAILDE